MRILILGLPGSGKTVQAKKISEILGFCFVKTGEILRDLAKTNSSTGQKIKQKLEIGELVDNGIVSHVVSERLQKPDCQEGVVIDGYPRSFSQLNSFDPRYDKVIYLEIPESLARYRLLKRGREDDTKEIIEKRLTVQKKELSKLLDYYKKLNNLYVIDGTKKIDEVFEQISQILT